MEYTKLVVTTLRNSISDTQWGIVGYKEHTTKSKSAIEILSCSVNLHNLKTLIKILRVFNKIQNFKACERYVLSKALNRNKKSPK